ncbi:MAG: carbohydrate-binding protein [Opitutaceae bacterium]
MSSLIKHLLATLSLLLVTQSIASVAYVNCDEFYQTSFENGKLEPYWECTFKRPSYIDVVRLGDRKAAKVWWSAKDYDGSRLDRGMEACSGDSKSELRFREDGWYGLSVYFPSDDYPMDKNCIVLQLFAHGKGGSWAGTLIMNDNRLSIEHRDWLTKNHTLGVLDEDIPRDTWLPIIIYWKPSTDPEVGKVKVWYKGAPEESPTYDYTGKFAYDDEWDGDTMQNGIGLKWGMYCADAADYTKNETRTVYYDDISQLKGNPYGAWELVNPLNDGRKANTIIDAEYYSDESGVETEICSDKNEGYNLTDLQESNWVAYHDMNFGDGMDHFRARVASEISGTIELRLDSPNGKLIGKCEVTPTGGNQEWETVRTNISTVSGKRDLYLTFSGRGDDLLSLNCFMFN